VKQGADSKKLAILGGLLVIAALVLYFNVFAGDSGSPSAPRPAAAVSAPPVPASANPTPPRRREASRNSVSEFKPRLGVARPEDRPDPATIDPTLRLDLLAKVQNVEPEQATRNLFQYGVAAPHPK
jgi:hypothetical protein